MKKHIIIPFLLFGIIVYSQQQTISYNNENLQNVFLDLGKRFNVHFSYNSTLLANKKFTFSDQTDLDMILLEIALQHHIKIEYIDSSNIVVTKFEDYEKKAFNSINLLEGVMVKSEYLTSGLDQNTENGTLSLQPSKLGVLPGLIEPDIMQSLQLIPGICSPSESASNLHIRGGTPDQNLILFDGIKMYHAGHLFGMVSPFNPYITEKVNIYRSGTSAKYGDRIAGVIDIRTINQIPDEFEAGIGANLLLADANIKAPIVKDKIGVILSARRSLIDVFESPTYKTMSSKVFQNTKTKNAPNTEKEDELEALEDLFKFTDLSVKVMIKPNEKHNISFSGIMIDNALNQTFVEDLEKPEEGEKPEYEGTKDKLELKNKGFSANWQAELTEKWNTSANLYYSNYDTNYYYKEFDGATIENSFFKDNDIIDVGAKLKAEYKINKKNIATLGYDWSKLNVIYDLEKTGENAYIENQNTNLNTHSLFAEYNYKDENLFLRTGVRTNYFSEVNKLTIEPRVYAHYKIDENWQLKTSAEIKNQAISQLVSFKFDNLGLDNTVWALTNKNVPMLENKQVTAGFLYSKNGWKLDVEGYYKNIKGLSSLTKGFNVTNQHSSYAYGKSSVYGADFLLKKRIKNFRTWLGYSISKNQFTFSKIQPESFPGNYDQRHVFSLSNTYKHKNFQFSLGWQYNTGKPYTKAKLRNIDTDNVTVTTNLLAYEKTNSSRLPNYHRLDASVVYDFYLDSKDKIKARVGASVMNIYNHKNTIDKRFKAEINKEGDVEFIKQTTIGLRTTPNVVFRVYF